MDQATKKAKDDADEKLARLSDMDTREVSVVDHAANKKVFLVVKRDSAAAPEATPAPAPAAAPTPEAKTETKKADADAVDAIGAAVATPVEKLDGPRARTLETIRKALGALYQIYVAEKAHPSDAFEVGSRLQETARVVDQAIAEFLTKKAPQEVPVIETVAKVGRPMQGDRLTRLKGAVVVLKEALADYMGGSVSLEKFKKAAQLLGGIVNELEVAKRVTERDERGVDPYAPNMGSGVQPDTSVIGTMKDVFGEGVPPQVAELMKRAAAEAVAGVRAENVKLAKALAGRDHELAARRAELAQIKKTRVAPSAPSDGGGSAPSAEDSFTGWPQDMAAESKSELARR